MEKNLPANYEKNEHGYLQQTQRKETSLVTAEADKAVAEIKAAYVMAASKPRDEESAYLKIMNACKRKTLAESALYVYRRGGQKVTGPSIRLAETVARAWGNLRCGVQEINRGALETTMRAYCTDLETNFADEKTFTIEHVRDTRQGRKELEDQRDIYENNANFAARRKRACILAVIPSDIVEDAIKQCEQTLAGDGSEPIKDRVKKMLLAFNDKFGVTKEQIIERLGHNLDNTNPAELVELQKIYTSIKDGMAKREDYFNFAASETGKAKDLNEALKANKVEEKPSGKNVDNVVDKDGDEGRLENPFEDEQNG